MVPYFGFKVQGNNKPGRLSSDMLYSVQKSSQAVPLSSERGSDNGIIPVSPVLLIER